jgi:hypothetical protein
MSVPEHDPPLTLAELASLQMGDQVVLGPLLKGLTVEQVLLQVVDGDDQHRLFEASYLGVSLGRWRAEFGDAEVIWRVPDGS